MSINDNLHTMRKLILEEWITLDGFTSDENGNLDFFPPADQHKNSDKDQLKFLDDIDLILLGKKTYEMFVDYWPKATVETEIVADKLNSISKIVFSNTIKVAPWGKWRPAKIVSDDAAQEVKRLKQMTGKGIVIWGSISLALSLVKDNLIDEYRVHLCPAVLGQGGSPFEYYRSSKMFKLLDMKSYENGVILLTYKIS